MRVLIVIIFSVSFYSCKKVSSNKISLFDDLFFREMCYLENAGISILNLELLNIKDEKTRMNKVLKNTNVFFRFSDTNCFSCIETILIYIDSVNNEFGNGKITFLTSYKNKEQLKKFLKIKNIKNKIYLVENNKLPYNVEKLNIPYFFILDQYGQTIILFIPDQKYESINKLFFKTLRNRFLTQ